MPDVKQLPLQGNNPNDPKNPKDIAVLDAKAVKPVDQKPDFNQLPVDENIEDPRSIIRQGLFIIFFFFGVMGVWAAVGEISGAVVAPGKIKIETERKTVQHLEGGIVDEILVKEGQEVEAGEPLIVLESVRVDADAARVQKQLVALRSAQVRLLAEKDFANTFTWPKDLVDEAKKAGNSEVLSNEEKIFAARRETVNAQISLLKSQLAQLEAQISGYQDQLRAEKTIITTLQEELAAKRKLYSQHFLDKTQILELERNLAGHQGNRGHLNQAIAETRQRSGEINLRIEDVKVRFVEQATNDLGKIENDINQTQEMMRPMDDAKKRLRIVAPVTGRVVDLKVHSKGGVVRPGEPLMDIVPHDNPLIVETQVPVNKITEVYIGQEALVQLDAFDTRIIPHMPGKVTYISADRLEDTRMPGAMPYYLCYVQVDKKALENEELYLSPGMPATVFITTRQTTVLYYILEPLIKNWDRALRD
ncbi:MAG: HlyD family type I secretion periplasmic adaptor subunit [Desulfovibrio sp.]|nr:HlyD family type I secretion periplasmic adaptor subunit [Desulfovibrio sp.]